jgi:hypothetical protein
MVHSVELLNYPVSSYYSSMCGNGRVGVPVSKDQAIYAQFEHVFGVASDQGGVSLNRVMILEGMIDRLMSIKSSQPKTEEARASFKDMSSDKIDALIEQYQGEIKTKVAQARVVAYRPQIELPPAFAFDLSA